jgi:hypothetical protein
MNGPGNSAAIHPGSRHHALPAGLIRPEVHMTIGFLGLLAAPGFLSSAPAIKALLCFVSRTGEGGSNRTDEIYRKAARLLAPYDVV